MKRSNKHTEYRPASLLSRTASVVSWSALALLATACGTPEEGAVPPEADNTQASSEPAPTASTPPAVQLTAEEALRRGKIVFLRCRACHSTESGGVHKVGPNLHGVLGSTAGSKEGFGYSNALKQAELAWTEQSLDKFLEKPSAYLPGTIMAFAGLDSAEDRAAVIAFIKSETQ